MKMTPLAIEMALHYHCTPGDYRDGDFSAPAVREVIDFMLETELIESKSGGGYRGTGKLAAYVAKLCTVGLPELRWIYPEDMKEER